MDNFWYKDAVFYELHIRAFMDSNGDGIGDIEGLTSRLEYLHDLGITCIWLLPMYPSPGRDDGYDIMDYYSINPEYGTLEQFRTMLDKAHALGMRVIADLVLNHTSDQHPWFLEAKQGPDNPYHDYYIWTDDPGYLSNVRIIFCDTEESNWAWAESCKRYYWHRFFHHQPDLNFNNPVVQEEMLKVVRFWLDLGLDGFRADAIPYLFVKEGTSCDNLPETHAYLKRMRDLIDKDYPGRVLLAEANLWPEDLVSYFGTGDEFHMAFNFPLMPRMFMALQQEHHGPIVDIISRIPEIPESCQWGIFLRNHDELTLEMVTDEERDYMYKAYARDPQMILNKGIRRRLVPLLDRDMRKVHLLYALLFTLPGTPIIYYGDEIGMGDNVFLGDRNGVRTPMQWNDNRNAGFSTCQPSRLYAPVSTDADYNYHAVNVEAQQNLSSSLLHWLKDFIRLRRQYPILSRGRLRFLYPENKRILIFTLGYEGGYMLCVFNMAASPQPVEVALQEYSGYLPVEIFGGTAFPRIGEWPYLLTLGPYGYYIFNLVRE